MTIVVIVRIKTLSSRGRFASLSTLCKLASSAEQVVPVIHPHATHRLAWDSIAVILVTESARAHSYFFTGT